MCAPRLAATRRRSSMGSGEQVGEVEQAELEVGRDRVRSDRAGPCSIVSLIRIPTTGRRCAARRGRPAKPPAVCEPLVHLLAQARERSVVAKDEVGAAPLLLGRELMGFAAGELVALPAAQFHDPPSAFRGGGLHVDEQIAFAGHRARLEQEGDVEDDRRDVARGEVAASRSESSRADARVEEFFEVGKRFGVAEGHARESGAVDGLPPGEDDAPKRRPPTRVRPLRRGACERSRRRRGPPRRVRRGARRRCSCRSRRRRAGR